MRRALIAPLTFLAGCAHVKGYEPPPGWCEKMPTEFTAQYMDGTPFVRAQPVEALPGAVEWTYYDKSGTPLLVERSVKNKALFFATYYPNGQKRVAGGYRIEGDRYVPQSHWELFTEDGQPDSQTLPDDFFVYRPTEIDHQPPDNYPEPTMYDGIPGNSCLLVCVDADGKFVGAYPLEQGSAELDKSAAASYLRYEFDPRKVGGQAVPSCQRLKFHFRP